MGWCATRNTIGAAVSAHSYTTSGIEQDVHVLHAGKDATEDFEEIGHSNAAKDLLSKYIIGDFEVCHPIIPLLTCLLLSELCLATGSKTAPCGALCHIDSALKTQESKGLQIACVWSGGDVL